MQDQEAREILEDVFLKAAMQVGTPLSARRYEKLKLDSQRQTVPAGENLYQKARDGANPGNIITDEPGGRLVLLTLSGFGRRNPAVVELVFTDADVTVTAWAKEGLIRQKSAQKAVEAALQELGLA